MRVFKRFRTFHSTPWFRGHESKALRIFGNMKHDFLQTIFMVNLTYPIYISKKYMLLLRKYLRLKYFLTRFDSNKRFVRLQIIAAWGR